LWLIEEGFLVRREAGTLSRLLETEGNTSVAEVRFQPVGAKSFSSLVALHGGREDVAFALVMGELDRLARYSAAGNSTTAVHGTVQRMRAILPSDALNGLPHAVAAGVEALRVRLGDSLLAKGKRILERMPREAMLRLAAPPNTDLHLGAKQRRRRRLIDRQ